MYTDGAACNGHWDARVPLDHSNIKDTETHGDAMDATARIAMVRGGGGGEAGGRWRWEQMRTTPDPAR